MGAETIELTADFAPESVARAGAIERQPAFWLGLACAALVHAALIVGIGSSSLRRMGEVGGRPDAINVELVDEADLRSEAPPVRPAPPGSAAQPPQPAPQPPQPAQPAQPPEPDAAPSAAAAAAAQAAIPPLEVEKPDWPALTAAPPTPKKEGHAKKDAKTAKPKPQAHLDLSLPSDLPAATAPPGASSVTRPPGVTRSGENDEFGRGVIRALRKTMPRLDVTGRVTVRIVLSPRGDKADVRLVQSGGDKNFDFEVMFSVNQASFPFPPKGATVIDRTFLVTYIYR
jgi:TonB family protein